MVTIIFGLAVTFIGHTILSENNNKLNPNPDKIDKTFGKEYFPTNIKNKLIYQSTFGDLELKVTKEYNIYLSSYDSDKFKYRQKLFINGKGLFLNEYVSI
ncbi:MAG: hypothetical protein ABI638_03650 [Ignavibacteriota bacterium]